MGSFGKGIQMTSFFFGIFLSIALLVPSAAAQAEGDVFDRVMRLKTLNCG